MCYLYADLKKEGKLTPLEVIFGITADGILGG